MSYRGKVKTGDDSCKARDNVEHIFGDGFEHNLPRSERRSIKLGLYFDMTKAAGIGGVRLPSAESWRGLTDGTKTRWLTKESGPVSRSRKVHMRKTVC